ncbi:MAG: histidine phosphatase family protein [Lysobacteraceae bacterium]
MRDRGHWFLRHPPLPQMAGRCYGRMDVAVPVDAIAAAARTLREAPAHAGLWTLPVLSSPAQRCLALARALVAPTTEPDCDARLLEMDFGAWEGLDWNAVPREALEAWSRDVCGYRPPGGECFSDVAARLVDVLAARPRPHLIVAHAGVIRAAWHVLGGLAPDRAAAVAVPHLQPIRIAPSDS